MSTFPNGYTCGSCGDFVGWNTQHECAGIRARTTALPAPVLSEAAVRRIVRDEIRSSMRALPRRVVARALPGRGSAVK